MGAIQTSPVAMSSFGEIAKDDYMWKQYCAELFKKNTFVTCGYIAAPRLRKKILELEES